MHPTTPSVRSTARRALTALVPFALAAGILTACGGDDDSSTTLAPTPRIIVTSIAGDPESALLAAIYSRALEDAGFRVTRRDPVSLDRDGYYAAVERGEIHVIPEWSSDLLSYVLDQPGSGTAPTTIVPTGPATTQAPVTVPTTSTTIAPTTTVDGSTTTGPSTSGPTTSASTDTTTTVSPTTSSGATAPTEPATTTTVAPTTTSGATTTTTTPPPNGRGAVEQLVALSALLPDTLAISSGSYTEKNDAIACAASAFDANPSVELSTYTHLASVAPSIRLGASSAWESDDEFGLPAWNRFYGGQFAEVAAIDATDLASALDEGTVDCVVIGSLDPLVTSARLTLLTDDRTMIRANVAVALLAGEVATPDLISAIDRISLSLTTARFNRMLNEIVANGTDPVVVANAFVDTL
ncbi:MAG: glycine betaine ABC transporter substrate-binding protein [Ilumatobacteraceae bacterium]